jgi:alpha-galactosidase
MFNSRIRRVGVSLLVCVASTCASAWGADTRQSVGDAYINQDSRSGVWTVGAGGASLSLSIDPSRDYLVTRLLSPSGRDWSIATQSDTTIMANGSALPFGSRGQGFQYETVATSATGNTLRLDATYLLTSAGLRLTRHVVVASGSPTFEVWTTFQSIRNGTTLSNPNAFQLLTPTGTVHWLTGHDGDAGDPTGDTAFMRREQTLAAGESLTLGARGRSSEQTVPWFALDGGQDEFFAALMWSGPWSLTLSRTGNNLAMSWGLAPMTTAVGAMPIEGPHALFGVARGALADASAALRSYVLNGLRQGRALTPAVTYNTWFAYGTAIDEMSMQAEMDRAAAMGVELFVVDAGWYAGADTANPSNFEPGLGSWEPDLARFPNGLGALADYAHSLGMKFGIWVEPERVNLSVVGQDGLDEKMLATLAGGYTSETTAQICLAGAAGRQWVLDHLTAFLEATRPDYLKWDNNLWVNCDRPGHGHGATDGPFAHVTALYQILDTLRQRFPNLQIENCSMGGNRVDFGMMRYTDVAWMDDHTAPSVHVRHNIEGLTAVFPPAYLLSFVTEASSEPLQNAPDLALYFRSRMGGVLGLCFRAEFLSDDDIASIIRETAIYKNVRTTLSVAAAALLTSQAQVSGGPDWDVMQATTPDGASMVVYAFQEDDAVQKVNVKPSNLNATATYAVTSVDAGSLGSATGADIMTNGIDVVQSPVSAAHILTLTVAVAP